ncbi:TPA: glycohydrolase toxin TNT-related protein [Citrobacter amalonaticus]|nr:glycohydrolase toxin TNT-related protein [Citrobacter amalonaticus]
MCGSCGAEGRVKCVWICQNSLKWIDSLGLYKNDFDKKIVLNNITFSAKEREQFNIFFLGESYEFKLLPGTRIDRFGSEYGTFVSPEEFPHRARSLKTGRN